jgi:hypothetical protein
MIETCKVCGYRYQTREGPRCKHVWKLEQDILDAPSGNNPRRERDALDALTDNYRGQCEGFREGFYIAGWIIGGGLGIAVGILLVWSLFHG